MDSMYDLTRRTIITSVNIFCADMAASVDAQDMKTLLEAKDTQIRNLESLLQVRDNEIQELRSHLDMFQSVFPFSNPVSPTATLSLHHPQAVPVSAFNQQPSSQNLVAKSLTSLLDGIARPRKQRAQGISAEPQSLSTIQELSQKKFPTYPKNDRYVLICKVIASATKMCKT